MGNRTSEDLATVSNLEVALHIHFRSNHYPPLPLSLIPVAIRIIKGKAKGKSVKLPRGISWRGRTSAPVSECIKAWHLEHFIISHEDYEQEE